MSIRRELAFIICQLLRDEVAALRSDLPIAIRQVSAARRTSLERSLLTRGKEMMFKHVKQPTMILQKNGLWVVEHSDETRGPYRYLIWALFIALVT